MKINHERTKNKILEITGLIRGQAQAATEYRQKSLNITQDETMSQNYKDEQIERLRDEYIRKYEETKQGLTKKLDEIIPLELENEAVLEFDIPEFANTMTAINAAEGNLPENVIKSIKLTFAGNYQALLSIRAAFERYGIDLEKYGYNEYTESVNTAITPLILEAENIERSEISTFISLRSLFRNVIKFGEVRGINFSESQKDFGEGYNEEAANILARQAMGLPVN